MNTFLQELAYNQGFGEGMQFAAILILFMFLLFQVKHLVVDFFVQNRFPYMWLNKGKFFHPGGWLHAGTHAVGSFGVFALVHPPSTPGSPWWYSVLALCGAELVAHFLIDLLKVRISSWRGWKCNTSPYFWDLLGVDQFLHQLTYVAMLFFWLL